MGERSSSLRRDKRPKKIIVMLLLLLLMLMMKLTPVLLTMVALHGRATELLEEGQATQTFFFLDDAIVRAVASCGLCWTKSKRA